MAQDTQQPAPPQNIAAEQGALGAALIDPGAWARLQATVRCEDFYPAAHRWVFAAMQAAGKGARPVDLLTVGAELRKAGHLEEIGGAQYLTALIGEVPTAAHVTRYAELVAAAAIQRQLIEIGAWLQEQGYNPNTAPGEALAQLKVRLAALETRMAPPDARVQTLADVYERYGDTRWLWPGWIPLGHLTLLFGRTKQGKSAVSLMLAAATTGQQLWPDMSSPVDTGHNALLIDTEAFEGGTAERATNWGLNRKRILTPDYGEEDPLSLDSADVKARLVGYIEAANARLTVVDSLSGGHKIDENSPQVRVFLRQLAEAARDTGTAILLVHHDRKSGRDPAERGRTYIAKVEDARGHGSIVASVRSIIAVDHPDGARRRHRLHVLAGNLAQAPEPVGFKQTEYGYPEWCDAPQEPEGMSKTDEAVRFLESYLHGGMRPVKEIEAAAKARGIDVRVLTGAAERIAKRISDGVQINWGLKERTA